MPLKDIPFVYTAPEVRIRNITASASSENNEKGTINNTLDPQNMNLAESRGLAIKNILT